VNSISFPRKLMEFREITGISDPAARAAWRAALPLRAVPDTLQNVTECHRINTAREAALRPPQAALEALRALESTPESTECYRINTPREAATREEGPCKGAQGGPCMGPPWCPSRPDG